MDKRQMIPMLLVAAGVVLLVGGRAWWSGGGVPEGRMPPGKRVDANGAGETKSSARHAMADRRARVLASWQRLQDGLAEVRPRAVRVVAVGTGAEEEEIRRAEAALGRPLPGEFREFLALWSGDVVEPGEVFQDRWEPFYEGCDLIQLHRMATVTRIMNEVAVQDMTEEEARVFGEREPRVGDFWHPRLVQFTNSHGGSELGVDCHTGEIWSYCGANYHLEGVVAPSFRGLLDAMSTSLEDGRFEIDELLYFKLPLRDEHGDLIE